MSEIKKDNNTASAKPEKKAEKANKTKKSNGGLMAFLKSRKAKHGTMAIAIVAVVVAITIVLNIVAALLVERFPNMVIDFTQENSFALEDDTVEYVSHLDKDITITVLAPEDQFEETGSYYIQANKLLEKIENSSNGKIKLSYMDITKNPSIAQKYSNADWTDASNIMIIECGDDYRVLGFEELFEYEQEYYEYYGEYYITGSLVEQAVVTAVLNVTTENKVKVDFITGYQEQDYTPVKALLESNAYDVEEISMATGELRDDAEFAVLYSPSVDLDSETVDKISKWLDNNGAYGRNLVFIPCENPIDTPNLDALLDEWGMKIEEGILFETDTNRLISSETPYAFTVAQEDYYKEGLKNPNIPIVTAFARSITLTNENIAHALLTTSNEAGTYPAEPDENWDPSQSIAGEPLNVAAEGVKKNAEEKTSRVVVYGSYGMFESHVLSYNGYNNSAYLINVFNTIADKDDVGITIEGKSMEAQTLGITDVTTKNILYVFFVVILPLGVLATGIIVWIRRRNK